MVENLEVLQSLGVNPVGIIAVISLLCGLFGVVFYLIVKKINEGDLIVGPVRFIQGNKKPIINQPYIDMKKELLELRKKRRYWENKYKKLKQTKTQEVENE